MPPGPIIKLSAAHADLETVVCEKKFSWITECRHLLSKKTLTVFWWPLFLAEQLHFTRSPLFKKLKRLPGFRDLWSTIQKGSFAYNNLFMGIRPFTQGKRTCLADLTTLALFFGDEFIDGIAEASGAPFISRIFRQTNKGLYLHHRKINGRSTVYLPESIEEWLPASLLDQQNPKYRISYRQLLHMLMELLAMMNVYLAKLPPGLAEKSATRITAASNCCLESYLDDIRSEARQGIVIHPDKVLVLHEMKTAFMQTRLLELRAVLAGKESVMQHIEMPGWLDIMRVVQIFDDIQDITVDDGLQDNLLLSVATHYFPAEAVWFRENKKSLRDRPQLSLYVMNLSCSIAYCFKLAAERIKTMTWEQQKIMHYLILKPDYALQYPRKKECDHDFPLRMYKAIAPSLSHMRPDEVKKFIIEVCMLSKLSRKRLLQKLKFSEHYQLRYNLFSCSPALKIEIFNRIT